MTRRDLRKALEDDLQQVEDNLSLYEQGRDSAYQAVAIQLRNLLLRGRRALATRVFPQLMLHQLRPIEDVEERLGRSDVGRTQVLARVTLSLQTAYPGAQARLQIAEDLPKLTVGQWLNQWVISPGLRIADLIEGVADEEVAHTQDEVGEVIEGTMVWHFGGAGWNRQLHQLVVVAIGEHIASQLREHAESVDV